MRYLIATCLLFALATSSASAQFRKQKRQTWPETEVELVQKIVKCLSEKDSASYYNLFPPFDTLWHMVIHNTSRDPQVMAELGKLKEHPQSLVEFDPLYNHSIMRNFFKVLEKGQDSGIRWNNVVIARYELHKEFLTNKALIGYEHISPERFSGHVFIHDKFNRSTFCMTLGEIQKIKGQFFGGQVYDILEASTIDEYNKKRKAEKKYLAWIATHPDTVAAKRDSTDSVALAREANDPLMLDALGSYDDEDEMDEISDLQVVNRKYYEGFMDKEIPIKLYVRYMRDFPGKPHQYDGLYKLDDNHTYLRVYIKQNKAGKWIIEDEIALGTMELTLKGDTYTGFWANANDNGYDIVLKETGTPEGKIEHLDKILDMGISGYVEESWFGPTKRELRRAERKERREERREKRNDEDEEKKDKDKEDKKDKKKDENGEPEDEESDTNEDE